MCITNGKNKGFYRGKTMRKGQNKGTKPQDMKQFIKLWFDNERVCVPF